MTINELRYKLETAYSIENLNKISLCLINYYKNEQFTILQKIAELISDCIEIEIDDNGKGFAKLIQLYHPDKASYHLKEIKQLAESENMDGLLSYAHILKLERMEELAQSLDAFEDIDYSPVYAWDINTDSFNSCSDDNPSKVQRKSSRYCDFYEAIKTRQYGDTEIEFPSWYLEDIDEFELSSSGINDLEGVQFCKHARVMDLSDNHISDISLLSNLQDLEELNLSENEISDIDALSNLLQLKRLYLADNEIEDFSPLLNLNTLEYVDLSKNKIAREQIEKFHQAGIHIDY